MRAGRRASFHERSGEWENAIDRGAGSVLRRLRHSGEDLANTRLLAATNEFQVRACHARRGDAPAVADSREGGAVGVQLRRLDSEACRNRSDIYRGQARGE